MDRSKVAVTGERFIPEARDEELEIEHLERYLCIKELVRDKVVLDAACGEGYGSSILSQTAASVLGVDIDAETIRRAREKYGVSAKLNYRQASVTDLSSISSDSIEVVVSYETIEHIDAESQIKFLAEISRVLKPDGILIMSTPDKKEYSDKYQFKNEFHIQEFYVQDFLDFLHSKFKNIKLYNQYLEVASFVECPEEKTEKIQYVIDRERYDAAAKYVIAIAGNETLPEQSIAMAFVHLRREYMPMMEELNYCRKEAIECRRKAERLDECLNENKLNNEELDRRQEELNHRMDEINARDRKIQEQDKEIVLLREKMKHLEKEDNRKIIELDHRMDEINIRDEKIGRQQNEIKLLNEELDRRAEELEHRMDAINCRDRENFEKKNEMNLLNEELGRRAIELDHRMDEINHRDREIDSQRNEIKLLKEELDRRAAELEQRMNKINILQEKSDYLDYIENLRFGALIKWFWKKEKN